MEPTEVEVRAEAIKAEANRLFAEKHYEGAIKQYTEAILLNPSVQAYYTNRALAHIKTESFGFAVNDADEAIKLDPTFSKAYYRRATANMGMMRFKEALADLRNVIKYSPRDPDARQKFDECQKIVRRIEFEKAIASDDIVKSAVEALGDIDSIIVEPSYDGPSFEEGLTPEFVKELMEHFKKQKLLHKKYVYKILVEAKKRFTAMKSLVHVAVPEDGRIIVCGDTHGQYFDLLHIFELNGLPSPTNAFLFNGDFVDRGSFSVEVIMTLLAWTLAYDEPVMFLSRGNHESLNMNEMYGFKGEVVAKYTPAAFNVFTEVFNAMPLVHVIGNKVFVVHGGLPSEDGVTLEAIERINRFRQPTGNDVMNDLLWADPQEHPGRGPSKRGTGLQFGPDVTERFCKLNNLDVIIRSHEVKEEGYEMAHGGKCITVFSAPNYCDAVGNLGAYIIIKPDLELKIEQFKAVPHPNVPPMKYSPMRGFGG
ncbi:Palmitoyl-protein thioesterase 1 [Blastocladiella emersonii ATCC 22665]|nr:Palmitoyl-protein thioesterase 1 [Blastocladiella emersonii ATCC 22665]